MVNVINEIRLIYKAAVDAVKPGQLVNQAVRCSGNVVKVKEELEIEVDKNCHVIGILSYEMYVLTISNFTFLK
jgi:uncharacterized protein YuzE